MTPSQLYALSVKDPDVRVVINRVVAGQGVDTLDELRDQYPQFYDDLVACVGGIVLLDINETATIDPLRDR